MKNIIRSAAIAALTFITVSSLSANEIKVGDLVIEQPVARATLPNAPVAGGYLVIKNTGSEDDKLIGGSAEFAGKVEIHEMKLENDVMKMRALGDGLVIPAGGEVVLEPGGLHVMFMKLGEQLKDGEKREAVLTFEKAGDVSITFDVKKINAHKNDHHGKHDDHSGHHDHGHKKEGHKH